MEAKPLRFITKESVFEYLAFPLLNISLNGIVCVYWYKAPDALSSPK